VTLKNPFDLSPVVFTIREVGLMTPISLTQELVLVAGNRRRTATRVLERATLAGGNLATNSLHTRIGAAATYVGIGVMSRTASAFNP
jgi:hypothetical protein